MMQRTAFLFLGVALVFGQGLKPAQAADAAAPKAELNILDLNQGKPCAETLDEFLALNGVSSEQQASLKDQICGNGLQTVVMVRQPEAAEASEAAAKKRLLTIDVNGSLSSGNTSNRNLGGNVRYENQWGPSTLSVILKGDYLLESTGSSFTSFLLDTTYGYMLDGHWSLFALGSIGSDSKKEIALVANEVAGVTFNAFEDTSKHSLKVAVGAGHRYQRTDTGELHQDFNTNSAIMSYRLTYEQKMLEDKISVIAAVWFQHILYGAGKDGAAAQVFDVTDYRLLAELTLRVAIANLGHGVVMNANFGGTYEYFVSSPAESPYDLVIKGGLGLTF